MADRNKWQAAEYLGVSVRTLQRIAEKKKGKGQYRPTYERGKTGQKVAVFNEATLLGWKAELESVASEPDSIEPVTYDKATPAETALVLGRAGNSPALTELIDALKRVGNAPENASITDLAHKLMLSLTDAAQLAGLSRGHLREAIETGKLKARIIGKGWKIKRSDLDAYIKRL